MTQGFELLVGMGTQVGDGVWIHFRMLAVNAAGLNCLGVMKETSKK